MHNEGFYTFKMGHGLFYQECRIIKRTRLKDGKRVEERGREYERHPVSRDTIFRMSRFGILPDLMSGCVESARITVKSFGFTADLNLVNGESEHVHYVFDRQGNQYSRRVLKSSSPGKVWPEPVQNWAMPKFIPDHAGAKYKSRKERVKRAVERALGRNVFKNM